MQLVPYLLVAVALVALVAFRARRPRVDHVAVQLEGAGLTRATPDARTWSLVRGGQRLTVSAPDRALLVTVDWTLASAPDDELRYTQQFVVVEGLPQPQLAPRDDATRVAAEAVTAAGRAFDGALTVSLGPETISTLAMEFQPQRIAERALALARTTEPLLAGVVDAYRMHPHLPLLTRTAALAAFGEALTASLPDLHRVPATQVPPSLDDSLPLERWQARFGDQVLSVDCSGERDAAQLTWTRGDTPTDALDDDYLTAWELDDDGRFALDDASEEPWAVEQERLFEEHRARLSGGDIAYVYAYADALEVGVWSVDPATLAAQAIAAVEPTRALHAALLERMGPLTEPAAPPASLPHVASAHTPAAVPAAPPPLAPTSDDRGPFL